MKSKIATLGPKGTYSDSAALKYINEHQQNYDIEYFGSIKKVLASVENGYELAVLPIENFSEGFVSLVLDHVIESDLTIVAEIILPIQFSFVTHAHSLAEVKQVYAQFVAKGQCSEYLENLEHVQIVTTESNIESLNTLKNGTQTCAAIVPSDAFEPNEFTTVIENVNDYKNNQTRFLVLSKAPKSHVKKETGNWKTSLVILDDHDGPGVLAEILTSFASRNVNLTSIISRPTKTAFGRYNFLIDVSGHSDDQAVKQAINEISQLTQVKNMGSYIAAEIV